MATKIDSSHQSGLLREDVLRAVKEIIGAQMGIEAASIRESAALEADLGCDSLDVIEIVMETEEHFDLAVSNETDDLPTTVADVVDGVLQLAGQPGA